MPLPSRPSIVDIARAAGVSPLLVSSMVSGQQDGTAIVTPEVAQRVRSAMQSLGYADPERPNRERQRAARVTLLICRMGSTYSRMLVAHTQAALAERGIALTVQEGEGPERIMQAARSTENGHRDGLIVETDDESASALAELATRGYPIVAIGPKELAAGYDVVTPDDGNAIRDAMLHLVDRGYERFVLVSPRSDSNRDYRTTIARDQLRALGVSPQDIHTMYSEHDPVAAFAMITPVLVTLDTPVAIVSGSDSCALGVLWACPRAALRVPEDVAVLGHGNSPDSEIAWPSLSTIGPGRSEMRMAADLMAERIDHPGMPARHVVEPWRFIPREST